MAALAGNYPATDILLIEVTRRNCTKAGRKSFLCQTSTIRRVFYVRTPLFLIPFCPCVPDS